MVDGGGKKRSQIEDTAAMVEGVDGWPERGSEGVMIRGARSDERQESGRGAHHHKPWDHPHESFGGRNRLQREGERNRPRGLKLCCSCPLT